MLLLLHLAPEQLLLLLHFHVVLRLLLLLQLGHE